MDKNKNNQSLILFDGVCNFCNFSVNFIIQHDKENNFVFAPLQSEIAKQKGVQFFFDISALESIVLIENEIVYVQSAAILRIAKKLEFPYKLFYGFIIVPAFVRNAVYNYVAKKRYKWFGKKDLCMVPTEEMKDKFIS